MARSGRLLTRSIGVGGARIALGELRRRGAGEVPAGREAQDADATVEAPVLARAPARSGSRATHRTAAPDADRGHAIPRHECGHADRGEPPGHRLAFMRRPPAIATARQHDERGAGRRARCRLVHRQRRRVLDAGPVGQRHRTGPQRQFGARGGQLRGGRRGHGERDEDSSRQAVVHGGVDESGTEVQRSTLSTRIGVQRSAFARLRLRVRRAGVRSGACYSMQPVPCSPGTRCPVPGTRS